MNSYSSSSSAVTARRRAPTIHVEEEHVLDRINRDVI